MIRLRDLLLENFQYWPDVILTQGIKHGMTLNVYHGTPNKQLNVINKPMHVGTSEQTETRIDTIWNDYPVFYEHEITIKLTNPYPKILHGVDHGASHSTEEFTKFGDYNEFVYHNDVEGYPAQEDNLSIFIVDFKKSFVSSKIINEIRTQYDASGIDTPGDPNI